jgi:hypothetical protein
VVNPVLLKLVIKNGSPKLLFISNIYSIKTPFLSCDNLKIILRGIALFENILALFVMNYFG